jgi:tetratricopeptide (TPR) repeat protein
MAPPPGNRHAPRSAIMRRPALAFALVGAISALAACAHVVDRYDFTPAGMRREVAHRLQIDPADVIVPFEVDEAAIARARAIVDAVADGNDRFEALVSSLSDPDGFGLRYQWAISGTAAQTLARGAGNCLALSSTLIGLARGVGMRATYLEVIVQDPQWRMEGDLTVQADHVAAVIGSGQQRLFVDFSGRLARARRIRAIDDFEALAHFYNNRGYEMLHRAEVQGLRVPWEMVARDFELATRIHPAHARAWNNLGVARARLGDDAGARRAYEKALALEKDIQSAHLNLVALFLRAGDLQRAAWHLDRARHLDPRNPQIDRLADTLTQSASAHGSGS